MLYSNFLKKIRKKILKDLVGIKKSPYICIEIKIEIITNTEL